MVNITQKCVEDLIKNKLNDDISSEIDDIEENSSDKNFQYNSNSIECILLKKNDYLQSKNKKYKIKLVKLQIKLLEIEQKEYNQRFIIENNKIDNTKQYKHIKKLYFYLCAEFLLLIIFLYIYLNQFLSNTNMN